MCLFWEIMYCIKLSRHVKWRIVRNIWLLFVFILSVAVDCYGPIPLFSSEEIRVFLTLSPLVRTIGGRTQQRQIELNWHSGETFAGDWIGLYDHDPVSNPASPLRQVAVRNSGYYKTDVEFAFPVIDRQNIDGDVCLGYWIGYNRNGVTIASNCLKLRPGWMWQNRYQIFFSKYLCLYTVLHKMVTK